MQQPMDSATFRADVVRRRRNQWTMHWLVMAASGLSILGGLAIGGHVSFGLVAGVAAAFMAPFWIGWFVYTRRNWSCPDCGTPLQSTNGNGYMWRLAKCKGCGRVAA
jgi:hypothetical protein